ncbi:MAG TPA: glycosyl hydrolase [Bacteroidales bacterium]|nr:glycosyl hydrolase [Bacteroidales bacterium]HPF01738.1 glycosyl hydrolase [Bacteroidales bacterium]HPJ59742.1 glycosyl hydrolase [Bacteroidales bacterium]HPR11782.1 glycosyl hydrolase [Bacteroidales bacterium]HRW84069.1 glycosyl hydrolase [Bacteroidales bacterium]
MKKLITLLLLVILASCAEKSRPWQEMSYPESGELTGLFKSPPPEYGMILWWGWDGRMSDTVIKRDLDRIKAMGFRGVMLEAGYGMEAKYLSPEWFSMVRVAVLEAKKRNMIVWIEDEGKYPSGFAGGKFSQERPDLKMQAVVVTERIDIAPGETISKDLPWYALSAVAFNNDDKSSITLDISSGKLNWTAPQGNWRIFVAGHRFRSSNTRSANNPTRGKDTTASLMDYLNPLATRQFLEWTHEQYKKSFGEEFGKTFMGFMGDEPDFAYTPYTPAILEEFSKRKGYDVKPWLASFFVPQMTDETKRVKADYWDVWSALFAENFFTVQADWCRENNIEYIVHLNHEDQLPGLVRSSGDYFRNMRNVVTPGVDAIWAQIWMDHVADYPKLASSAAHLYGRARAFTESFAAFTHRPSVSQAKWVLDYQMVRGINSIQVMFMSASTPRPAPPAVPAAQQRPASQSSQQRPASQTPRPISFFLTDTFPPVAEYLNRASFLLAQGKPAAETGLYFPTMSMWYGDNESNRSMLDISRQLLECQRDYDFVDEQALTTFLSIENGGLKNLSGQSYKAIIVPSISVISSAALNKLKDFSSAGGKVIFVGNPPSLVVEKTFLEAGGSPDLSWAHRDTSNLLTDEAMKLLPPPDISIDKFLPQVKYLHREWKDAHLYFIFNEEKEPVSFNATFREKGEMQVWDAATGSVSGFSGSEVDLGPWETKFIVIKK